MDTKEYRTYKICGQRDGIAYNEQKQPIEEVNSLGEKVLVCPPGTRPCDISALTDSNISLEPQICIENDRFCPITDLVFDKPNENVINEYELVET